MHAEVWEPPPDLQEFLNFELSEYNKTYVQNYWANIMELKHIYYTQKVWKPNVNEFKMFKMYLICWVSFSPDIISSTFLL